LSNNRAITTLTKKQTLAEKEDRALKMIRRRHNASSSMPLPLLPPRHDSQDVVAGDEVGVGEVVAVAVEEAGE
jgi:hypothetical protein